MVKKKAVDQALQAALDSWNWRPPPNPHAVPLVDSAASRGLRTESSVTVFSGDLEEWVSYLSSTPEERVEPGIGVRVHLHPELRLAAFEAENEDSRWLSNLLARAIQETRERLANKPHVLRTLDALLFEPSNSQLPTRIVLSPEVPSDGAREVDCEEPISDVRIVLHSRLARYISEALEGQPTLSSNERLGVCWPLISRLIFGLGFPASPRDRFAAKVEVSAKLAYVSVNVLFDGRKSGQLIASAAGQRYAAMVSESSAIPLAQLMEHHPYWRMLGKLGFVVRGDPYLSCADDVRSAVREYLDVVYLRLSLSGAMPGVAPMMQPMPFEHTGRRVSTPNPEINRYGILDRDDLDAWKLVRNSFRDVGFILLRQLGLGEFGRVYEALNHNNPHFPERVAIKVDRIAGKKKHAILEAEAAMEVGRGLANASHLIRLYDTGKLRGQRFTYHVLQLIEGDTLDNLVGVTGTEHASVSRPPHARLSDYEAQQEFERALQPGKSEIWRRSRMNLPFQHALSTATVLDLLTSVLLWLEDVHRIGYAINDLKNGNLMMSRRGQLKGIDLDSYAPVHSPRDKVTDFMFLAVSLILLLFSVPVANRGRHVSWEELVVSEARLRSGLAEAWPFGDVEESSAGRVTREELTQVIVDLVHRSRHLTYTKKPELYSEDVGRLISVKRRLLFEEMVID